MLNGQDSWLTLAVAADRKTMLNNRCAIYYPQLPALFLSGKGA
jgi:hypothetical protein